MKRGAAFLVLLVGTCLTGSVLAGGKESHRDEPDLEQVFLGLVGDFINRHPTDLRGKGLVQGDLIVVRQGSTGAPWRLAFKEVPASMVEVRWSPLWWMVTKFMLDTSKEDAEAGSAVPFAEIARASIKDFSPYTEAFKLDPGPYIHGGVILSLIDKPVLPDHARVATVSLALDDKRRRSIARQVALAHGMAVPHLVARYRRTDRNLIGFSFSMPSASVMWALGIKGEPAKADACWPEDQK